MPELSIVPHGDSAAVVLPSAIMESIGLSIGDKVEVTMGDRQLVLRPVENAGRKQRVQEITRDVLDQRRDAYQRLA